MKKDVKEINIEKIKVDLENIKSQNRILLHNLTKYSVRQIEKEYFKHLKK